ncbi:hypothetical protein Q3G72_019499 [Acer saccharum]|nr:hypothetical protein Q3G72_019499 [Acer saccharum]
MARTPPPPVMRCHVLRRDGFFFKKDLQKWGCRHELVDDENEVEVESMALVVFQENDTWSRATEAYLFDMGGGARFPSVMAGGKPLAITVAPTAVCEIGPSLSL